MNKTELESKHLAELHALAVKAGIERYRTLGRAELIEKLAAGSKPAGERTSSGRGRESSQRRSRERKPRERRPEGTREPRRREQAPPAPRAEQAPPAREQVAREPASGERPRRRRRRRRWGRRRKGVRVHDLLLPGAGRQAIVYAESRETCTALLREVAAQLADAAKGPDPIALLIDPGPEELADWRRDAPQAEIVAAGKANHADDAIAQAIRRAEAGEDVIVLIDSLSRFADSYGDADGARGLLDAALSASQSAAGSLTVVAAVEKP